VKPGLSSDPRRPKTRDLFTDSDENDRSLAKAGQFRKRAFFRSEEAC